jgi:cytochrome P450
MPVETKIPEVLSEEYAADPYAVYHQLLDHAPVHYDPSIQAWLVSRRDDIRTVFRHPEVNSNNYEWQFEEVHGRTILQMNGREHAEHRRLLNPFLSGGGLASLQPMMHRLAAEMIQPIIERESARVGRQLIGEVVEREKEAVASGERRHAQMEMVQDFTRRYPIAVTREMMGIPHSEHERVQGWYMAMAGNIQNLGGEEGPIERGLKARAELEEYLFPIIQERRGGDGTDMISAFTRAEVEGRPLTDEEIRAYISLILIAGGETTDEGLTNLFYHLVHNPDQFQAVYDDRSLIADAMAEMLRVQPPVQMIIRVMEPEIELQGVTIPAGSSIACMLAAGNIDDTVFERPTEFDVFRKDNDTGRAFRGSADHLAFGDGRHFCAGAMFASVEMTEAINLILDEMAGPCWFPEGHEPEFAGIWTRQPKEIRLEFDLKHPQ